MSRYPKSPAKSLRIHTPMAMPPRVWTPFGWIAARVWTPAEWAELPESDRPDEAQLSPSNGCYVHVYRVDGPAEPLG